MPSLGGDMSARLWRILRVGSILCFACLLCEPPGLGQSEEGPPGRPAAQDANAQTASSVPDDQEANKCKTLAVPSGGSASDWTGWGFNPANWRYQPNPGVGLSAADVPHLKLKWAFGIPNVRSVRSQPVIYDGRVYVGGLDGTVYSLDANSGCGFWATKGRPVRSGLVIGHIGAADAPDALFYGDATGGIDALNASTGKFLWRTQADPHPVATITGTLSYFERRLYVPVSSGEEQLRRRPDYECCTFQGSVVSMDAATGKILWQTYMARETPSPHGKTPEGKTIIGHSGMA